MARASSTVKATKIVEGLNSKTKSARTIANTIAMHGHVVAKVLVARVEGRFEDEDNVSLHTHT